MQELAGRCRLETIDPSSGDAMKGIKPMGPNASKRYRRTIIFVYVLWIAMESSNFESQTLDVDFLFMRVTINAPNKTEWTKNDCVDLLNEGIFSSQASLWYKLCSRVFMQYDQWLVQRSCYRWDASNLEYLASLEAAFKYNGLNEVPQQAIRHIIVPAITRKKHATLYLLKTKEL
ncbi:hypothetical protein T265_00574 [Opisthorchis viverrini]|uniref:Uncharacterized protein n=1 Tax=Opisthorchis viverrini TaxID=6198 RepID=A0A075A1X3_OPIVI|nr:hypothetical protein T265_00574 [Opisthorchis viverrini]KER33693.1 hypothetical protein T265_00574 [Opisthorchis viverrini]